ncbi:MAG: ABC transporter substrate-binding protein [Solirubrobacteraceae bacterium]
MKPRNTELDRLRIGRSEVENHYIDELVSGHLDRRQFLRRGAVIGMSTGLMGAILSACGGANNTSSASSSSSEGTPKKGGTLRVATQAPSAAVNPLTVSDSGGLVMLNQTGEFLTFYNNLKLALEPMLALSWTPNSDGSVWTFKLRPGVTFHNGQAMTADDVVYTFQELSNPKNASNALSAFRGALLPSGVKKVDSMTVAFHLVTANGNFPYLVSSDNYNAIIVPKGTDFAKWQSTFMGTGAFKLGKYTQNVGAQFVPNPSHWGGGPYLDGTNFTFYTSQAPQILALQGGQVDVITQFVAQGAQGLLNNPSFTIITLKSSNHRELSMRTDQAPFTDARVRQAVALTMDRPGMVAALLAGKGLLGNDSAFSPVFHSTDTSVPQRTQNIAMAKQLLSAAGHANGFTTQLVTEIYQEIPALAQVMKANMAKAGINANLKVETQSQYYGKATVGNSDWLDGSMSLVDYGSRGVPNVFITSTLTSDGTWNAARFKNPTYDKLVTQYVAALDLPTQKQLAGKIQTLLLQETPLVIPYFIDGLTATKSNVHGVNPTAISQIYLDKAYIS